MSRAVMQQALEDICGAKLCEINSMSSRVEMVRLMDSAITALRAALTEPEQEPVALSDERIDFIADTVVKGMPEGISGFCKSWGWRQFARAILQDCAGHYAPTPQPEQEPVAWYFVRDLDKGISFAPDRDPEKPWQPLYTAPTQAIEPVAWMVYTESGASAYVTDSPNDLIGAYRALPLYTAPAPRNWVGLTDEEIDVGLCRSPYALQTAQAWRDGVEWAQEQLKEKNT